MKYSVKVKEISYGVVEVEAASAEEAKETAEAEYYFGNVFWNNSEADYTVEPLKERKRDDAR